MVAHEKSKRPISVIGPDGHAITVADLPPTNARRWVVRRKATVVTAVRGGLLTLEEACDRYKLSEEEFQTWQRAIDEHGVLGLRLTTRQDYREKEKIMIESPLATSLPRTSSGADASRAGQVGGAKPVSELNILVVDDDRDFAESLANVLELDGHRTASAFSASEGLACLGKNEFDFAFVDIVMPGKDGLDVLWANHNLQLKTHIVLMTAHNAAQFSEQGKVLRAVDVLQKPFDPAQVTQCLEAL